MIVPRELRLYRAPDGNRPFSEWIMRLKDMRGKEVVLKRLDRLTLGNLGDARSVGQGVWELKIHFGPGYRVYFGQDSDSIIVLLCGGDKSTQSRDIERAHNYWADYCRRNI